MTQPTIESHYSGPFPVTLNDGTACRSPEDYQRWLATKQEAHDSTARRVQTHDGASGGFTVGDYMRERADAHAAADAVDAVEVVDVANRPDVLVDSLLAREPSQPAKPSDWTTGTTDASKGDVEVVDLANRHDIALGFQQEE